MKIKKLKTDIVMGNKIETYVITSKELKPNGLPIEFVINKETIGAYDHNDNEQIGICGYVSVICDKYTTKIRKLIERDYKVSKPYPNTIESTTYVSPDDFETMFTTYVNAIKEVAI